MSRARPEPVWRPGAQAATADDDNTAWLITFSDVVLQLFGFVLLSTVLGRGAHPAAPSPPPTPPAPVRMAVAAPEPLPVIPPPLAVAAAPPANAVAPPGPAVVADAAPRGEPAPVVAVAAAPASTDAVAGELRALAAATPDGVSVTVRDAEVVLTLSDTITFPSGSAELLPAAVPILRGVRTLAASLPGYAVHVEGHTDDVQIHTAAFPSNLELSLARAARVARELTADGTLRERTAASGFGDQRPLASNADDTGRARNRRVEIRLVRRDPAA
jgi:flagellar motor protein MotB